MESRENVIAFLHLHILQSCAIKGIQIHRCTVFSVDCYLYYYEIFICVPFCSYHLQFYFILF